MGNLPERVGVILFEVEVARAHTKLTDVVVSRHRRSVQFYGGLKRGVAVVREIAREALDSGLVSLSDESGEVALSHSRELGRNGGFPLLNSEDVSDIQPLFRHNHAIRPQMGHNLAHREE